MINKHFIIYFFMPTKVTLFIENVTLLRGHFNVMFKQLRDVLHYE